MPLKTHQDEQPSLNLTPMIDIVFLLIIFFMVGTKFTELSEAEQSLPLEVPKVSKAGALTAAPTKRVINVFRDGSVTLDRQPMSLAQLDQDLRQALIDYPKIGIVIRGDAEGRFQNVANVLAVCREAGVSNFAISVQLEETQTAARPNGDSSKEQR